MKVKTVDLKGVALDWAVAQCEGTRFQIDEHEGLVISTLIGWISYRPSTAWVHGGPIVDRERIAINPMPDGSWWAQGSDLRPFYHNTTPLLAAMRCYVASKLGDEIDVPEELL